MIEFIKELSIYVNGGCLSRSDKAISYLNGSIPFFFNSKKFQSAFLRHNEIPAEACLKEISISPYAGENPFVLEMKEFIQTHLKEDLTDALVHGSLGTYEEIPYSDFDALVILKDEIFRKRKRIMEVAMKLCKARKIMLAFDPLQHHGWFVLTESALQNYPLTYFPPELFSYSKSILHTSVQIFQIRYSATADFKKPFYNLCSSLTSKLTGPAGPDNIYAVKNLMSEFMLLPAFYVQARDERGIFKKLSFDAARGDFSKEQWKVMDEISEIRQNWNTILSESNKNTLVAKINRKGNFLTGKTIPEDLRSKLNPDVLKRMIRLVNEAKDKVK